jgi:hypothetical protein
MRIGTKLSHSQSRYDGELSPMTDCGCQIAPEIMDINYERPALLRSVITPPNNKLQSQHIQLMKSGDTGNDTLSLANILIVGRRFYPHSVSVLLILSGFQLPAGRCRHCWGMNFCMSLILVFLFRTRRSQAIWAIWNGWVFREPYLVVGGSPTMAVLVASSHGLLSTPEAPEKLIGTSKGTQSNLVKR